MPKSKASRKIKKGSKKNSLISSCSGNSLTDITASQPGAKNLVI